MKIIRIASAGTLESSDAYVEASPSECGLEISVESVVEEQFGEQILASMREVAEALGVTSGKLSIKDRGALDCTIRARTEAAIMRAGGEK